MPPGPASLTLRDEINIQRMSGCPEKYRYWAELVKQMPLDEARQYFTADPVLQRSKFPCPFCDELAETMTLKSRGDAYQCRGKHMKREISPNNMMVILRILLTTVHEHADEFLRMEKTKLWNVFKRGGPQQSALTRSTDGKENVEPAGEPSPLAAGRQSADDSRPAGRGRRRRQGRMRPVSDSESSDPESADPDAVRARPSPSPEGSRVSGHRRQSVAESEAASRLLTKRLEEAQRKLARALGREQQLAQEVEELRGDLQSNLAHHKEQENLQISQIFELQSEQALALLREHRLTAMVYELQAALRASESAGAEQAAELEGEIMELRAEQVELRAQQVRALASERQLQVRIQELEAKLVPASEGATGMVEQPGSQ